jgi:hypothetical protein
MDYISGDLITNEISTLQFFPDEQYFNRYIKNYISNINLITTDVYDKNKPLIIITKVEYLEDFYNKILPLLKNEFVLITHCGDVSAGFHYKIIQHPLLIKWYGVNMGVISDKTSGIPLGLENRYWKRTNILTIKKHSNNQKRNLLYLNFSLRTHPNRSKIMNNLLQKGFTKNKQLDWEHYIEELSAHKFCISPRGNGVDCHRTWECLYLGVIPIVENSIQMSYFNDLPILFVDSYDVISTEYLNKMYDIFKNKTFNVDKCTLSYWNKTIKEHFE